MIADLVLIGVAASLDPIHLSAFLLIFSSRGGVKKGAAFIIGWLVSFVVVVTVTIVATGDHPPRRSSNPAVTVLAVKIFIGLVLLAFAERQRRRLGRPTNPPRWRGRIDHMTPLFAMGLAPLVEPWAITIAGITVILDARISSLRSALGLVCFCLLTTSSILVIELYGVLRPDRARTSLSRLLHWMDLHTSQITIVVFVALGLWLIGHSSYQLS